MKHLLLVFSFRLFARNRVASLRVDRFQRDHVVVSQARNRTHEHGLQSLTLADLTPNLSGHALIWRAPHESERTAHTVFGKNIQKRRLTELHSQRLLERSIKDRVSGRVDEIRQEDRVLFGQGTRAAKLKEENRRSNGNRCESRKHDRAFLVARDFSNGVLGTRCLARARLARPRSEEHTSELQSHHDLV